MKECKDCLDKDNCVSQKDCLRNEIIKELSKEWDYPVKYEKSDKYEGFYAVNEYGSPSIYYGTPYPKNRLLIEQSINPDEGTNDISLKGMKMLIEFFELGDE